MSDIPRCSVCRDWLSPCASCITKNFRKKPQENPPVPTGYVYRKLNNGTFLVGFSGDLNNNHWHLAADGTVLSVKEGGNHLFRRTDVTKQIRDVCPELDISFLWNG